MQATSLMPEPRTDHVAGWKQQARRTAWRCKAQLLHHGRLWRAMGWTAAGNALGQGLRAAASILVARLLQPAAFGQFSLLAATANTAGTVSLLGTGVLLTRNVSQWRERQRADLGRLLAASYGGCCVVAGSIALWTWLCPKQVGTLLLGSSAPLETEVRLLGVLILIQAWLSLTGAALAGFEAFDRIAKAQALQGSLLVPLMSLGALTVGLRGAMLASFVAALAAAIMQQLWLQALCKAHQIELRWREMHRSFRQLGSAWTAISVASLSNVPVQWLAWLLLARAPNGAVEVGIFAAANQWRGLLLFLPSVAERANLPILTCAWSETNWAAYRALVKAQALAGSLSATLLGLGIALASPWVMSWYGASYESRWPVLVLAAGAGILAAWSTPAGTAILAAGRYSWGAFTNLGWAAVLILVAAPMAWRWGATGLGVAYVAASASLLVLNHWLWRKHCRGQSGAFVEPTFVSRGDRSAGGWAVLGGGAC